MLATEIQYVQWHENETLRQARWLSQSNHVPPARIVVVDDKTTADEAYRLACAGTSMLWRGDFNNARQLLQAITRRIDRANERSEQRKINKEANKPAKSAKSTDETLAPSKDIPNLFHQQRQVQSQRSRLLSRLLLELDAGYVSQLRRAPDVSAACTAAFGELNESCLISFRDLQGALGAAGWRVKGVAIENLGLSIFPHYGVFAPTRHEYVQLLLDAPLPASYDVAFDIGTGTGLLAIILAQRGVKQVIATDLNLRALACASDNLTRLDLPAVQLQQADLYPNDAPLANLLVCNPPWLPAKPTSPLEFAVYDANSTMLRGFLQGAKQHLAKQGEVWLILSDLAEHLQLRSRDELLGWFANAGLEVKYRLNTQPKHGRSQDDTDPLFAARNAEVTSLWCLVAVNT
ncbi:methyltransferase [Psychrobacter cryohalolentis]|uniref:Methyltransferase small n=1 Tax=Psychrobacter cryohalolentis (strain ATCC BAA-1226 / DSM 17306 / VKM B-2378 / K5) TaxID=335284 RepID=Q1QER1_PSYCK|nr:class I SAM-dependent methyltransferase [Psychrobacter cryohalolentis]ABE73842.1 methyltransferase small [Psychrobacter cryohalolentis K5]ASE26481.1 methyltransferase domain-containing protein [Psychrobacter cryohalolentis]